MQSRTQSPGLTLLIACSISFVCFFSSHMRIPIVPLFAASLGADTVRVGMINGAFMLMAGMLSIPAGLVSDRLGRRLPMLGGLFLLAASSFLLYWSSTPLQLTLIYLLFGAGLSAFSPSLMSHVADATPPDKLGRAYGWYTMSLYGGMTLGPAAGGFLGGTLGLRPVFLVSGCLILCMLLAATLLLRAPVSERSRATAGKPILPELQELLKNRSLLACLAATIGGCIAFGMFVTFMPLFTHSLGLDSSQMGLVFAAQALSNALSRLPSGRMSDRFRKRYLLVSISMVLFAVAVAAFGLCRSLTSLIFTAAAMGLSMGCAFTVISALIADSVPRTSRGIAMGCYNTCIYIGMMCSSAGLGAVIRGNGFKAGFLLSALACLASALLFQLFYRDTRTAADNP